MGIIELLEYNNSKGRNQSLINIAMDQGEAKCEKCGMPLNEETSCSCEANTCIYCCSCEENCECGCRDKKDKQKD